MILSRSNSVANLIRKLATEENKTALEKLTEIEQLQYLLDKDLSIDLFIGENAIFEGWELKEDTDWDIAIQSKNLIIAFDSGPEEFYICNDNNPVLQSISTIGCIFDKIEFAELHMKPMQVLPISKEAEKIKKCVNDLTTAVVTKIEGLVKQKDKILQEAIHQRGYDKLNNLIEKSKEDNSTGIFAYWFEDSSGQRVTPIVKIFANMQGDITDYFMSQFKGLEIID